MGVALDLSLKDLEKEAQRLGKLRDQFEEDLLKENGVLRNGHPEQRLSHVSNLAFEGIDSQKLVEAMRNLAVSTGSACTSAKMEPSHVLKAMGRPDNLAFGSVRFSLGRFTSEEEMQFASSYVKTTLNKLRAYSAT